jgi:serine protease Do
LPKHLWLFALLTLTLSFGQAQTLSREIRERIILSTVMVLPTNDEGKLDGSLGSGTIISPLGYILTNYHVVGDIENRKVSEWLQIRTIRFVDQAPEFRYWGKVVDADPNLDLAIVKIVEDKDEKPVSNLNLPYIELGDSNKTIIGDPIFVFGFQGTGGMTLSFSKGSVGGFTGEDRESSGKQWIKHDAQTGPGNSGGGVYNQDGALIGVHSAGVAGNNNSRTAFMRPISLAWGLITPNVPRFVVQNSDKPVVQPPAPQPPAPQTNWPPNVAVGQTWAIAIKGHSDWTVKLEGKDSQGDPKGKAVSSKKENLEAFFYYEAKEDTVWLDMTADSSAYLVCQFERQNFNGTTLVGGGYYKKNKDAKYEKVGDCTAKLGLANQPTGLKWPLKPAIGQTWTFVIQNGGVWTVKLTEPDKQGDPMGEATSTKGEKWTAFIYYKAEDDTLWMDMTPDGKAYTSCKFEAKSLTGSNLSGIGLYFKNTDADGDRLGTCTASLR